MRSIGISLISLSLTAAVIGNAFYQKKQFYPSVVYITKSNPSMAVIYIQSLVLVLMLGKLMRKVFLGTLRAAEFEHLMERFWYALTETCLAFTVFRDDFNPKFVALFTVLLFLKSFHWLAEDRVDYMERSPVIGWLFHLRVASLLIVLTLLDYLMISHAYHSTITKGATVQLVFGFEYAILITMVANTTIKYVLHAAEMRSDAPWDNKAVFLLYTELIIGFVRVVLYILFVIIMVRIYTLPLFAFRPMYYTMRNFKKALNDVILSRRAIRNMNTLYPDATPEELVLSDNICIICREDMVNTSKKLPCGHIFHTACLRSWFQRQQTCPTCRLNILRTPITATQPPPAAPAPPPLIPPIANPNAGNNNNNNNLNNNNILPLGANPFANLLAPPNPMAGGFNFGNAHVGPTFPMMPGAVPFAMPPMPFMTPYAIPPPPMPNNLDTLTDDELRELEGIERHNVEQRLTLLKNIQLMLNASSALMSQYNAVVATLSIPVPNPAVIPPLVLPPVIPPEFISPVIEPLVHTAAIIPNPATVTPVASTSATASVSTATSTLESEKASTPAAAAEEIKLEDLGSEEHLDLPQKPTEGFAGTNEPSTSTNFYSNETAEVRRRRLQKFLQSEQAE